MKQKLIIIICIFAFVLLIIYNFFSKNDYSEISQNEIYGLSYESTESVQESIVVHIAGEVINPGIVTIPEGSRIINVIDLAGGLTDKADISKINLAYIVSDAEKIYIPNIDEATSESYVSSSVNNNSTSAKININTATQSELEALPGIGASTALKIINYRNEHGKFKNPEDIMNVSGIGENKYSNIKDYIKTK